MGKNSRRKREPKVSTIPTPLNIDRSIFWSDLQSIPSEDKNELWCAQNLFFFKRNAKLFLDPGTAATYRGTDKLDLNEATYKQIFDPITPMGGGGTATYVSADWKANPVYIHLKNIVKAEIEKTGKSLEVNMTDKFAKTRKMRDNYRILYKKAFRTLINEISPLIGMSNLDESQDPFKWAQSFSNGKGGTKVDLSQQPDEVVTKFVDLIKNQISDSQDLALYNELIYKGDYEMAFELGIDYYIMSLNKWNDRYADKFIDDVMHFNKVCGEWYTDLMTGRPVIEYFLPERLWVSPFRQKDGEDLMYYFTEYSITFGDFAKTIGKKLTPEKLEEVFLYQKTQGSNHGLNWTGVVNIADRTRDNAMINIGRAACLSQDIKPFLDDINASYPSYEPLVKDWKPQEGDNKERVDKYFNVWYSWYYIPPTTNSLSSADFQWQAQFIFDIKKNQDQFRYGEDGRYSKSPLVIYDNSSQASFTDITQAYMPKIHNAWHNFQNCLVNDFEATIFSDEFIGGLLGAVDEDNKINPGDLHKPSGGNGKDAYLEQWRAIKQGGKGFLKMVDKNGQPIMDPSKMVLSVKNGFLERAEKYIALIAILYQEMTKALAFSPMTAGEEIKPRTPVAALEQSLKAADSSKFFIQKGYEAFLKMYAERIICYILLIARENKDGYTKRWDEFMENVGYANGLAIEGLVDTPPENVGLTVEYVDNTAKKEFIMALAAEYVKTKQITEDFVSLLMGVDNWKYCLCLLRMAIKAGKKEMQAEAAQQQQFIMEQKQMDLQIALALAGAKTQGVNSNIQTEGQIQAMVNDALNKAKFESQSRLLEQRGESKKEASALSTEQEKDKKTHEADLRQQEAIGTQK